jgi:hypothetical protein
LYPNVYEAVTRRERFQALHNAEGNKRLRDALIRRFA